MDEIMGMDDQAQGEVVGAPIGETNNSEQHQVNEEAAQAGNQQNVKNEPATQPDNTGWFIKDEIQGDGDTPPFLLEKYGYNLWKQAQAYPDAEKKIGELNQRLGAATGAPAEYDFSSLEQDFEFDKQNETFNTFVEECRNNNISQEFAAKIAGLAKNMLMAPESNYDEEVKAYGENYQKDVSNIENWVKNNSSEGDAAELMKGVTTAGALRALRNLMNTQGFSVPGSEVHQEPKQSLKDLKREYVENLYNGDNLAQNPDKIDKWVERFGEIIG